MVTDFRGVYPALITPMTEDDQLHEAAFRHLIEFNIQAGVHGFWVAGGSGESVLLDDEENARMARIAVDQAAGRAGIIMHVGAPTTRRAARMAERAAAAGVDAICCVPPFFYDKSDATIVEHYRVVAAAAARPFFAYNLPKSTGVEISQDLLAGFQERVPEFTGLKHSSTEFSQVRAFVRMGATCFIGSGALMLPALAMGAAGCIDGWPAVAPELWVELWDAFQRRDYTAALTAQDRCIDLIRVRRHGHFLSVVKAIASERLGIECGTPRAPADPLTPESRAALLTDLAALQLAPVDIRVS